MIGTSKIKAIGLISGGLDSSLAVKLLKQQGVDVIGLNFYTGFSDEERNLRLGIPNLRRLKTVEGLGIDVEIVDISEEFLTALLNPKYGYGKNMNPCIDCKILMLKKAKEKMEAFGACFVFTGEVLNQRPFSQRRRYFEIMERESGLCGYILRPLSARLLPPTHPEIAGWVDRGGFLGIRGRSRKIQMELAQRFGIEDYPQPSGGCILTDPSFSRRLKEFLEHRADMHTLTIDDFSPLFFGRHFRLPSGAKLIISRDERETKVLEMLSKKSYVFLRTLGAKATGMLQTENPPEDIKLASRILARYTNLKHVRVIWNGSFIDVEPLPPYESDRFKIS